ncbi:MAG: DUF692 domain-containing protein [Nitratireductor sp.]
MQSTILQSGLQAFPCSLHPLQPRAGAGLKAEHVAEILETRPEVAFFEIHAENYMGAGGMPHAQLRAIREHHALSVHGVGMSIGGEAEINREHLARFKAVVDIYQPALVSEHLAWSTHDDVFFNDLLPLPYSDETLERVVRHVCMVQDAIGRQILIENPSSYVMFAESQWAEPDFMAEIARRSGCALLFDVNNVFVSSVNSATSPLDYIAAYPLELVQEIHLAGHAPDVDDHGNALLIDAHDRMVADDVWTLFASVLERTGALPTLIEWDNEVPHWPVLHGETCKANAFLAGCEKRAGGKVAMQREMVLS